jgi:DNA-binding IscR family transcriptional regulator
VWAKAQQAILDVLSAAFIADMAEQTKYIRPSATIHMISARTMPSPAK